MIITKSGGYTLRAYCRPIHATPGLFCLHFTSSLESAKCPDQERVVFECTLDYDGLYSLAAILEQQ